MRLLPKPYPEETVGSVLLRGRLRMGLDLKSFLKWVFDAPGRSTASFLLEANAVRVASMCGLSPSTLLARHTIFPYAIAFQKEDQAAKHRERLLDATLTKVGAVAPLVANCVHRGFRRLCLDCVAEDLVTLGESYWRRSHQLATVFVCTKHDSALVEWDGCPVPTLSTRGLGLPHHSGKTMQSRLELSMRVARALSEVSESLLNGAHQFSEHPSDGVYSQYRQRAEALGFTYPHGGLATSVVADTLARFYGSRFLDDLGCRVGGDYGKSWPSLLFRKSAHQATTTRHVLLQCFLMEVRLDEEAMTALTVRRYTPRDYSRLDVKLAGRLRDEINGLAKSGAVGTVIQILKSTSSYGTFKHNRHRLPLSKKVVDEFRSSNLSARPARKRQSLDGPKQITSTCQCHE